MILCEGIPEHEYGRALHLLRRDNPAAAWGLTFHPEGDKYLFPEHGVYVCLKETRPHLRRFRTVEVTGAFRHGEGKPGATVAIADLCKTLGFEVMELDCFEPVAPAWYAAGLRLYRQERFNSAYAPSLWLPEYGKPDVLYLRKHFGGLYD